jgi:hypothetical protein
MQPHLWPNHPNQSCPITTIQVINNEQILKEASYFLAEILQTNNKKKLVE